MPTTARNAAGEQAKTSPKSAYQRPHRVHMEKEVEVAEIRHHDADLEEEAHKRHVHDADSESVRGAEEEEDEVYRVETFAFDDRKKKGRREHDDEEAQPGEDGEAAAEAAQAAVKKGLVGAEGAGRYFQDMPEDRLGDPSLTNPNEMKRVLGATARFAQHAMILAQSKIDAGMTRAEAIAYLAKIYSDLGDRPYAKKALREFGHATGILDIYPLEVIDHLFEFVPGFYVNMQRGRFFTSSTSSRYRVRAGEVIPLTYPPELKIRGFAIKGGDRPGYLFEPTDPRGTYALTFQNAGTFHVLISAIARGRALLIEELVCEVEAGDAAAFEESAAIKRERTPEVEPKPKEREAEPLETDLRIHLKQRI